MNNLQIFIHNLATMCGEAAWADYWLSETIPLVQNLSESEWQELKLLWPMQEEQWQVRFAQIIEFGQPTHAAALFVDMLLSATSLVAIHAAAGLKAHNIITFNNKSKVRDRLLELIVTTNSNIDKLSIMEYLRMIG